MSMTKSGTSVAENAANASSAGVGHYKGVMLCNRPFAGTQANHKLAAGTKSDKQTFTCGVVPDSMGINVPISMKEKQIKRPKKDNVLVKHKRWLAELQRTKDRLEETYIEEMKAKEEAQAKFQDQEKKMRDYSRTLLQLKDDKQYASAPALHSSTSPQSEEKDSNKTNNNQLESKSDEKESNKAAGKVSRPAWAMTEEKAEVLSEAKKEAEEDDLLNFASSLNYEKYIGDIEVKLMMDRLRKRIQDLEREVALEDQRELDAEAKAARREMLELMGQTESRLMQENEAKVSEESLALQTAKALLDDEENEINTNVHSTKSVVALLKTAKEKIANVQGQVKASQMAIITPSVTNEPKIVVHEPNEGARLEGKNTVVVFDED